MNAQQRDSKWSFHVGAQWSYAFKNTPTSLSSESSDFLSGYSPAYGIGGLGGLKYSISSKVKFSSNIGFDAHAFSYDLIGPPTFGEVGGRTVPGRNLTAFKGVGTSWFAELETEISMGNSSWLPVFMLRGSFRSWLMEHSNANTAYTAGFGSSNSRQATKQQLHYGAGFGLSPFAEKNQISIVYQRTFEPYEPLFEMLVLRQVFVISKRNNGVDCPIF